MSWADFSQIETNVDLAKAEIRHIKKHTVLMKRWLTYDLLLINFNNIRFIYIFNPVLWLLEQMSFVFSSPSIESTLSFSLFSSFLLPD